MDLARMLEKCRRYQWSVDDLDWSTPPRSMSREDEIAIVQYFTDMAGIELLAGALFEEQRQKATDPTLREIFASFVEDERRHSEAAARLARHYDVHQFRVYGQNPALVRFAPHFVNAVRYLSAEVANIYITTGELILDIALLRSLNDYVDDAMSEAAMHLINRDESRHIAIDFHMIDYYASDAYLAERKKEPRPPLRQRIKAWWALGNMFYFAAPFFRDVFFKPMELIDPTNRRILESFKRIQLVGVKRRVKRRPFVRFIQGMQSLYQNPVTRPVLGGLAVRVLGLQPRVLATLYTEAERERAQRMSIDQLAEEALAAKYA